MSGRLVFQPAGNPNDGRLLVINAVTGRVAFTDGSKPLVLIVDPSIPELDVAVTRLPQRDGNFRIARVRSPREWVETESPEHARNETPFVVCLVVPLERITRECIWEDVQLIRNELSWTMGFIIGPPGSEETLGPLAGEVGLNAATLPLRLAGFSEMLAKKLHAASKFTPHDPPREPEQEPQATVVAKPKRRRYNPRTMANQDTLFAERGSFSRYSADEIDLIARSSTLAARHERYDETRKVYAQAPTDENAASVRAAAKNLRDKQKEIGLSPEAPHPLVSQAVKQLRQPVADPHLPANAPTLKARSAAFG